MNGFFMEISLRLTVWGRRGFGGSADRQPDYADRQCGSAITVYRTIPIIYHAQVADDSLWESMTDEVARLSEEKLIEHARQLIARAPADPSELLAEYQALLGQYTRLRDQSLRLARISDKMQRKLIETNILVKQKVEQLTATEEKLLQLSVTDTLTGLPNRRGAYQYLDELERRHRRTREPFTVFIVDIDHFKKVNDRHGHNAGDQVLVQLARTMRDSIREQDFLGRWGGEEFIIVLPETEGEGARTLADKVRHRAAAERTAWEGAEIRITISLGGCGYSDEKGRMGCLESADRALYQSKAQGRNRVVLYATPGGSSISAKSRPKVS
jgi:diguanylate cyclase (GGDEF)-like protein